MSHFVFDKTYEGPELVMQIRSSKCFNKHWFYTTPCWWKFNNDPFNEYNDFEINWKIFQLINAPVS